MSKPAAQSPPPDQIERQRALDPAQSILVQAPAGSGKTDLLARRFLRLLGEVDEPGEVVAITFTNAAAAEMRHRILAELEKAATIHALDADEFSMNALAHRALEHSQALGWKLLDLPAQLRVRTIDSFCRELALQLPLLSGFGGGLNIAEQPDELYRRAARETLRKIDQNDSELGTAIEKLLLWRDNGWQEMEELLVEMLGSRDRWMHDFVLEREKDWEALRERLERPFMKVVRETLTTLHELLSLISQELEEVLQLARYAYAKTGNTLHGELAELAEFPSGPLTNYEAFEEARDKYIALGALLLTNEGKFRKQVDKRLGFPTGPRAPKGFDKVSHHILETQMGRVPCEEDEKKGQMMALLQRLATIPGLEASLAAVRALPSVRYTEEEWEIVKACFRLLREAAGELQIAFAEAGAVDFIEVAQIAQRVLKGDDGLPTEAAMGVSDNIRHLLVDEFQDTSRRQHQLLSSLIAAWPERAGRTCFVVGDPMQSIYFFRDADAELFPRVKALGLEIPHDRPLLFDFVPLKANFRSARTLVKRLNYGLGKVFEINDGSDVSFSSAYSARNEEQGHRASFTYPRFQLHLEFVNRTKRGKSADPRASHQNDTTREAQIEEIVTLIGNYTDRIKQAKASREKYRIAVLGRARNHLVPIALALRKANEEARRENRQTIPFRAVELEQLSDRPEILDALALARALLNSQDRVAWLGVLRAPWCGLSLDDLHLLAGNDDPQSRPRPLPELIAERRTLLSEAGRLAAGRVLDTLASAPALRAAQPTASLGTWLEKVWLLLGGQACVDQTARANLNLLWSCLDRLPGGEPDLLGPGLDAVLDKLTALPDPEVSSDCGVQLMTIHKSKGLEFEVVIVPELQARIGRGRIKMLSWLERGLPEPDESGEITEFLIAPFQPKRDDRGKAKEWVDRVYRERESQETRRILYVAATRAREELHLFARPACKEENGDFTLVEPANSLLATAWPVLRKLVQKRFNAWTKGVKEAEIESIAASGESNLAVMPSPIRPTLLRRLPPDYQPLQTESFLKAVMEPSVVGMSTGPARLYPRHEGGLLSRALGTAVHTLLEELALLCTKFDWEAARAALLHFEPRIAAQVRAVGVDQLQAAQIAAQALQLALKASHDTTGSWILSPHAGAASEAGWAGVVAGLLRAVRVDRVFKAGPAPCAEGEDYWWIIDYKTAHADNMDPAQALPGLRQLYAPQVEAYAELLRNMHGADSPIFAGLYYPRMLLLDWWEL